MRRMIVSGKRGSRRRRAVVASPSSCLVRVTLGARADD
jgi:hypothetical protein